MPEIERPDKLDCLNAKPAVALYDEKTVTSIEQSKKFNIVCDNDVTLGDKDTALLNSKVVVDHLSASWTLVSVVMKYYTTMYANVQESDKLVLNDISFHVDQVCTFLYSSLLHCMCSLVGYWC